MKTPIRVLLIILSLSLVFAMPFLFSSPSMLIEYSENLQEQLESEEEDEEEDLEAFSLLDLFMGRACAEETPAVTDLPTDFTVPPVPNSAGYTETSYEDASISVQVETVEESGIIWRVARISIASPSQLRTAVYGKPTRKGNNAHVIDIAKANNAVVAINSDFFRNDPDKTTFEYRQGTKIGAKKNSKKDILIIDFDGNFHTFFASKNLPDFPTDRIYQAFTFGPVLVHEGTVNTVPKDYGYNPMGAEPRTAIGQTGELSYVLVVAEGRGESAGATQQQLADFMGTLGCVEAFNLDGGNSTYMVFNGEYVNTFSSNERSQSDIIYFATAVDEGGN